MRRMKDGEADLGEAREIINPIDDEYWNRIQRALAEQPMQREQVKYREMGLVRTWRGVIIDQIALDIGLSGEGGLFNATVVAPVNRQMAQEIISVLNEWLATPEPDQETP